MSLGFAPDWPAPRNVRAWVTARSGGVSKGAFGDGRGGGGLNLGLHCGDDPVAVAANRGRLEALLPQPPRWLRLAHGTTVVDAEAVGDLAPAADAAVATSPGVVCAVTMADCLPVLLADRRGGAVGIAHAGWRGLAAGVIQATVRAMRDRLADPAADLVAWLGPAIGREHFEVGPEVLAAMQQTLPAARDAFDQVGGRLRADLHRLAIQALAQAGVASVSGARLCTYSEPGRFYSYRRDRVTGRHAALIWIVSDDEDDQLTTLECQRDRRTAPNSWSGNGGTIPEG